MLKGSSRRSRRVSDCGCNSHGGFLTAKGLEEAAQRERWLTEVDAMDPGRYVDRVGSVSALVEVEDDSEYDSLHVELNHSSTFLQLEMF